MVMFLDYSDGNWPPIVDCGFACGDYLYAIGVEPPRYPVPALADTATVLCLTLGSYNRIGERIVWDGVWRDNVPDYVPFVCPN